MVISIYEDDKWKDIEGYDGAYKINRYGVVISFRQYKQGKRITQSVNKCGYVTVSLYKEGKLKTYTKHRLLAKAFVSNPYNHPCVNHIDENKQNNHISNLEWCTHKYNTNHGTSIARRSATQSTEVMGVNIETGERLHFKSLSEAGKNGFTRQSISSCVKGISITHKGFRWYQLNDNAHKTQK